MHKYRVHGFIIHGHDEFNTRRLEKLLSAEFQIEPHRSVKSWSSAIFLTLIASVRLQVRSLTKEWPLG